MAASVDDEAAQIVSAGNLHRSLWLPATDSHARLRVTFSTTSNFDGHSQPVVLFCGPMFSSRWMALDVDRLARDTGVRIICTDRPGMGGSTRVPLNQRVQVWIETVPVLLATLGVEHVQALVCHSTGVIYALNTLYRWRDVLDPERPYVACIAPWVNDNGPHTALMKAASILPNTLFDQWHTVAGFAARHVAPSFAWSAGLVSLDPESPSDRTLTGKYGTTVAVAREVERLKTLYLFREDASGADEDARLCLRKPGADWGVCADGAGFVREFVGLEKRRPGGTRRLEVHAYFASSDAMIGQRGRELFETYWRQPGVDEVVGFRSWTLDDTSHDGVLADLEKGALRRVFEHVVDRTGGVDADGGDGALS